MSVFLLWIIIVIEVKRFLFSLSYLYSLRFCPTYLRKQLDISSNTGSSDNTCTGTGWPLAIAWMLENQGIQRKVRGGGVKKSGKFNEKLSKSGKVILLKKMLTSQVVTCISIFCQTFSNFKAKAKDKAINYLRVSVINFTVLLAYWHIVLVLLLFAWDIGGIIKTGQRDKGTREVAANFFLMVH